MCVQEETGDYWACKLKGLKDVFGLKKAHAPPVHVLQIVTSQLLMCESVTRLLTPLYLSPPKVSTVAAATCSVPSTVTLTNTTVPMITGVQLLPAYAKRTPSWWPRKFRSYEDWVEREEKKKILWWCESEQWWLKWKHLISWLHLFMVVWGGWAGQGRAGQGGEGWGVEIAATVHKPPLLASPSLSTSDCDRVFLCACMCRCAFCMEVCVGVSPFARESGREPKGRGGH